MKSHKLASLILAGSFALTNVHADDFILIDSFTDGSSFTLSNTSGTASYNNISGAADILGGSRQVRTRAAGSGFYGPSAISVDVSADTLSSFGGDSGDRYIQYGSAIGSQTFTGAGPGTPVNLGLDLTLDTTITIDVASASSGDTVGISLFSADSSEHDATINISSAGTYTVPLSSFSGLTAGEASTVNGLEFNPESGASSASAGLVLDGLSLQVPEPSALALLAVSLVCAAPLARRAKRA